MRGGNVSRYTISDLVADPLGYSSGGSSRSAVKREQVLRDPKHFEALVQQEWGATELRVHIINITAR